MTVPGSLAEEQSVGPLLTSDEQAAHQPPAAVALRLGYYILIIIKLTAWFTSSFVTNSSWFYFYDFSFSCVLPRSLDVSFINTLPLIFSQCC